MTPPDNVSNRTLAGIAAALGITVGVVPAALLAQATTPTTQPPSAVYNKVPAVQNKNVVAKQLKPIAPGTGVPAVQGKFTTGAPTPGAATPLSANQGKPTAQFYKATVPAVQLKTKISASQLKSVVGGVPAVQEKDKTFVPAVQAKQSPQ